MGDFLQLLKHWNHPAKISINMEVEKEIGELANFVPPNQESLKPIGTKTYVKTIVPAKSPKDPFLPEKVICSTM